MDSGEKKYYFWFKPLIKRFPSQCLCNAEENDFFFSTKPQEMLENMIQRRALEAEFKEFGGDGRPLSCITSCYAG